MRRVWRILIAFVLSLALLYAILAWTSPPVPAYGFFADLPPVAVIAHQGGERLWPSNTMYAYTRAEALGVDVLEMDVHSSADGVLVLIHDDTVDRTTNGSGRVNDQTLVELQALDAGYYWTEDEQSYPFRDMGIVMPTLEEVFAAFPGVLMNIEIKQETPPIEEALCDLIHRFGKEDEVLIASFMPEVMDRFREICPSIATSGTEPEILPYYVLSRLGLSAIYRSPATAFQVPEYNGSLRVISPGFVRGTRRHNIAVHVWTVNEEEDMQRMLDAGVDGIITDRPDRLMALLGR
jgi:glycerophosphoryl diester phosphodiesterase